MSVAGATRRLKEAIKSEVRPREPMSRHTSFRIGGPAALFVTLDSLSDLSATLRILAEEEVEHTVLGKGTNLLVSDSGYPGAVLVLGREFRRHSIEDEFVKSGAGVVLATLVQDAYSKGKAGMEFAVGIPGTLGGALAMNAGAGGDWISSAVESVTVYSTDGALCRIPASAIGWGYRSSGLAGRGIIVEGVLRVRDGDPRAIRAQMERNFRFRKESQPLNKPSAGSVFVNPEGDAAGRLIEGAGLKGMRSGGARVSPVHANFIVNDGQATAWDVVGLIRKVQMAVKDAYGIELRPEIRFLGSFEQT